MPSKFELKYVSEMSKTSKKLQNNGVFEKFLSEILFLKTSLAQRIEIVFRK